MDLPSDRQSMAHEVAMYQHLDGTGITPDFLGHIIDEAGLAIGFLLEYIVSENEANQGRRQRMQACMTVLQRLHNDHGIAHGDTHDGNCLVRKDGSAVLIDFELAEKNAPEAELARDKSIMDRCIRSLPDEDMTSQAL
ncbi:hypothetical protein SBRCBS47491_002690 [Sporothrix bragantina]|uniref:Aminoglycoside phosphotransferase domain-containing protein n=1 Tax=Sporothrix bragantina TaxID=671064 RepID=A0ABP0B8Y1_9PEZI